MLINGKKHSAVASATKNSDDAGTSLHVYVKVMVKRLKSHHGFNVSIKDKNDKLARLRFEHRCYAESDDYWEEVMLVKLSWDNIISQGSILCQQIACYSIRDIDCLICNVGFSLRTQSRSGCALM